LSVPVIGTLGLVIRAKLRGQIVSAAAVLADLQRAGLYLNEKIVTRALMEIGESGKL
jgi:predicted nucleic acid-binding protein